MRERVTLEGARPETFATYAQRFEAVYRADGVAIFPGFLKGDARFERFVGDLHRVVGQLGSWAGAGVELERAGAALEEKITCLARVRRDLVGKLYDLGTRPNKLLSGMLLKTHPAFLHMIDQVFGERAPLVASPTLSDTLHVFPPGADSHRFNLPVHQDYPYLLQSPRQITFWISLSDHRPEVGGMTVWAGSHALGVLPQRRDAHGHLTCDVDGVDLGRYDELNLRAGYGDLVVFHSSLLHRSDKNLSRDHTRVVQLFRFSDLLDDESLRIRWEPADVTPRAKAFEDFYASLVRPVGPESAEGV